MSKKGWRKILSIVLAAAMLSTSTPVSILAESQPEATVGETSVTVPDTAGTAPETAPVAETPAPAATPAAETPAPTVTPAAETPAPETTPAEKTPETSAVGNETGTPAAASGTEETGTGSDKQSSDKATGNETVTDDTSKGTTDQGTTGGTTDPSSTQPSSDGKNEETGSTEEKTDETDPTGGKTDETDPTGGKTDETGNQNETDPTEEETKTTVNVTWSNTSFTYNGEKQKPSYTLSENVEVTLTVDTAVNAGTYNAKLSLANKADEEKYELSGAECSFKIEQAQINSVTWEENGNPMSAEPITYDTKKHMPAAYYEDVKGNKTALKVTGDSSYNYTDAGDYEVNAALKTDAEINNYAFAEGAKTTAVLKINKADALKETLPEELVKNYTEGSFTLSPTDFANAEVTFESSDESVVKYDNNKKDLAAIVGTGEAAVTVSVKDALNFNDQTKTIKIKVEQGSLVLTIANAEKTYGDEDPEFTYSAAGLRDGDILAEQDVILSREDKAEDVNDYEITADVSKAVSDNYEVTINSGTLTIKPKEITVSADDKKKIYGDDDEELTYTAEGIVEGDTLDIEVAREEGEDAGEYEITAAEKEVEGSKNANYSITFETGTYTIEQREAKLVWYDTDLAYNGQDQKPVAEVNNLVDWSEKGGEPDTCIVTVDGAQKDAGKYTAEAVKLDNDNYKLPEAPTSEYTIAKLAVTIIPDALEKVYGSDDPEHFTYAVDEEYKERFATTYQEHKQNEVSPIEPTAIIDELGDILDREEGEDVVIGEDGKEGASIGGYAYVLNEAGTSAANYTLTITENPAVFTITPLAVKVTPKAGQSKIYGEKDPDNFDYEVAIVEKDYVGKTEKEIQEELGKAIFIREEEGSRADNKEKTTAHSEQVGTYPIVLDKGVVDKLTNYSITAAEEVFTINPLVIEFGGPVNSRTEEFIISSNGTSSEPTKSRFLVFKAKFPGEEGTAKGIKFSTELSDYVSGTELAGEKTTIKVAQNTYSLASDAKQSWDGRLPAGTTLVAYVIDDAKEGENAQVVSNPIQLTVGTVSVSLDWSASITSASGSAAGAAYYLSKSDTLNITGTESEKVIVTYKGGPHYFDSLDASIAHGVNGFDLISNGANTHNVQSISADFADKLNLVSEEKSTTFVYDDQAFPVSSMQYLNRGDKITITLPELGRITNVTINGAVITVTDEMSQTHEFAVKFSGSNLIPSGTGISVTYVDQGGNEVTSSGSVGRSSVSTPLTVNIQPALVNGYLNGQNGSTLVVSGTGCICEPIRITLGGITNSTNVSVVETWSDSQGTWVSTFDMTRLQDGETFTITVEYADVNGSSATLSGIYNPYVQKPLAASPVYEGLTYISGMAEPGAQVYLYFDGEGYEVNVDRYGHFFVDDLPFVGVEDEPLPFRIEVRDVAGNVNYYDGLIPKPQDPFTADGRINPLGMIFYNADKDNAEYRVATPLELEKLQKSPLDLPLLMGLSYEIGTLHAEAKDGKIVVTSTIDENIDTDDYQIKEENLFVFEDKPGWDDLKNYRGKKYSYGEEIPVDEDGIIWIVDEKEMNILADDFMDLEVFDFENNDEYRAYQEYQGHED